MRILMLTQWFYPEPFFKGLPFAKELIRRGNDVEVLTGFPNYPGGKIYNGYHLRLWQREKVDGVTVNRVYLYPSHDESGIRRIINYLSFALSAVFLGSWLVRKPDVVYVYNLVTLAWAATFLRWIYGCKIIYDVQDLWPESVVSSGMLKNRLVLGLLHRWCLWAYKTADQIVVLSPGFKQNLQRRGIPEDKIEVIYNWCDTDSTLPERSGDQLAKELGLVDSFNVMFAGTMGVMQGLETVLEAARICAEELPNIRFIFVGDGIDKKRLFDKSKETGLTNVIFVPRQPMSKMGEFFAFADTLLVHLKNDDLFRITIPSKTQAYLAAGRPVIMAVSGDAADLIEMTNAGYACVSEDPDAIVSCIKKLCALSSEERVCMGKRGKDFYIKELSIDCGVRKFEALFRSTLTEDV